MMYYIKLFLATLVVFFAVDMVWRFFATPENLNRMTPKDMRVEITSELSLEMHEGLNIRINGSLK